MLTTPDRGLAGQQVSQENEFARLRHDNAKHIEEKLKKIQFQYDLYLRFERVQLLDGSVEVKAFVYRLTPTYAAVRVGDVRFIARRKWSWRRLGKALHEISHTGLATTLSVNEQMEVLAGLQEILER